MAKHVVSFIFEKPDNDHGSIYHHERSDDEELDVKKMTSSLEILLSESTLGLKR